MLFDGRTKTIKELMPKFDRWVDEFVWGPDSKAIYFASGDAGQNDDLRFQFEDDPDDAVPNRLTNDGEFSRSAAESWTEIRWWRRG